MKLIYDKETDTLTYRFRTLPVAVSYEDEPGLILDFDASGNFLGFEILNASKRIAKEED